MSFITEIPGAAAKLATWLAPSAPPPNAPPGVPPAELVWVPPGSGGGMTLPANGDAQAIVDALINKQFQDQQALNAAKVQTTWGSEFQGALYQAGAAASGGKWLLIGAAAVVGLLILSRR